MADNAVLNAWMEQALTQEKLVLRAQNPERNVNRFYAVTIGRSLFSTYAVYTNNGRVGTHGRMRIHEVTSMEEVKSYLKRCLKRRLSAVKRLGVSYEAVAPRMVFG